MNRLKIKIGILVCCTCSLCYMAFSPVIASIAAAFPDTDISLVQMIMTLPNFMFIIFSPLAGKLALKVRKKTLVLTAITLYLVGGVFPWFFHSNIWTILLGSVIIGCGSGLLMPVLNAIICDYFEMEERAQLMGLNATCVAVGAMVFIFTGGQLVAAHDWTWCFLAYLLMIPILAAAYFCLPSEAVRQEEKAASGSGFEMNPYVAFLFAVGFIYFAIQNAFNTNSSLYLEETAIGGTGAASLVTMVNTLGGITGGALFGLAVGKAKDQVGSLALALSAAGFLGSFFLRSMPPFLLCAVLTGLAFAFYNATGTYLLSKYLKPENNAFTVSIYMATINVGASLSPFVVNGTSGVFGKGIALRYLVCGVVLVGCMVASIFANQVHQRENTGVNV